MTNVRHFTYLSITSLCLGACTSARPATFAAHATPCAIRSPIAAALWAETANRGAIEGHVRQIEMLTDSSDHPLNNTEVNISGPVEQTTVVDSSGEFHMANLPAGHYAITVRHDGFPTRRDSLVIDSTGVAGDIRLRRGVRYAACAASRVATMEAPDNQ